MWQIRQDDIDEKLLNELQQNIIKLICDANLSLGQISWLFRSILLKIEEQINLLHYDDFEFELK